MIGNEIGSEFNKELSENGNGIKYPRPGLLLFSGRTAIESVLKHIPNRRTALLPSYCCDSMIEPFRRFGIIVDFYPVNYENGLEIKLEIPSDIDIVMLCNYFGFHANISGFDQITNFSGVVVEDITHSLLSTHQYHPQSQYLVASLRKWEPIYSGGYCAAVNGAFEHELLPPPPQEFISLKSHAMQLKAEYLTDLDEKKKSRFLPMFAESNHWLAENFSGLSIDCWSQDYLSHVDVEKQRKTRRDNAHVLYEGLKNKVQFMFLEEDMDCPLFVPVLIPGKRDEARKYLIDNQIYCPVHWPKPEGFESNIYDMELSLICDQRYREEDMRRIVSVLREVL